MQFEESGDRLVVRHQARAWFVKWLGYTGLVSLPLAVLMAIANVVGHAGLSWMTVTGGLLYGAFGVALLFRAPLALEIVADRAAKRLTVRRMFRFGADAKDYAVSDIEGIATAGATGPNMSVVTCHLRVAGGGSIALVGEGGFPSAQAETRELAQKLSAFLGVPLASG